MRAAAFLITLLAAAPAMAAPPELAASLPVLFDLVFPGRPEPIDGQLTVRFPDDAQCGPGIPYGFHIANRTAGSIVEILTPNGTIPGPSVQPGVTHTIPFQARLSVEPTMVAYTRIDVQLRADTGACGTVDAGRTVTQTGAKVGYVPSVALEAASETAKAWRMRAVNAGNAETRVEWVLRQPTLGRVISSQSVSVPGPEAEASARSAEFLVPKAGLDESARAVLDATLVYSGAIAYATDERPPAGAVSLVLYEPSSVSGGTSALQYVLLALAVLLIVGGVLGGWWLRRPKKKA